MGYIIVVLGEKNYVDNNSKIHFHSDSEHRHIIQSHWKQFIVAVLDVADKNVALQFLFSALEIFTKQPVHREIRYRMS